MDNGVSDRNSQRQCICCVTDTVHLVGVTDLIVARAKDQHVVSRVGQCQFKVARQSCSGNSRVVGPVQRPNCSAGTDPFPIEIQLLTSGARQLVDNRSVGGQCPRQVPVQRQCQLSAG